MGEGEIGIAWGEWVWGRKCRLFLASPDYRCGRAEVRSDAALIYYGRDERQLRQVKKENVRTYIALQHSDVFVMTAVAVYLFCDIGSLCWVLFSQICRS